MSYPKINILIPMAGEGSRFAKDGYADPKPFIPVLGKPMIQRVMENVNMPNANFILVARASHLEKYMHVVDTLKQTYSIELILLDKLTEGTALTVLSAFKSINNDTPLLIANSDQIVDIQISDYINDCYAKNADGSILCFEDAEMNPKWSFAKINEAGFVTEVKEKEAISNLATVGIYFFAKGVAYCQDAIEMIVANERVNNEFYTCPVYNYSIKRGAKILTYTINPSGMNGIGTPDDLNTYIAKIS
jgi:UDP-N-acetylglucosamine diphosphorylase / glucose-1-phosphate thymidylyltransferase / UDP-N-acetylgalactosamine diphosphorylase / glucosamine-1-phosphate N-acetyltransferase / galactosamine-1-phosphate N-acetyltransferase